MLRYTKEERRFDLPNASPVPGNPDAPNPANTTSVGDVVVSSTTSFLSTPPPHIGNETDNSSNATDSKEDQIAEPPVNNADPDGPIIEEPADNPVKNISNVSKWEETSAPFSVTTPSFSGIPGTTSPNPFGVGNASVNFTTPTPLITGSANGGSGSSNIGAISGGAAGGFVFVAGVAAAALFYRQRYGLRSNAGHNRTELTSRGPTPQSSPEKPKVSAGAEKLGNQASA